MSVKFRFEVYVIAEKTAKNLMGIFLPHPVECSVVGVRNLKPCAKRHL